MTKSALVTGASRGIGKAIALRLSRLSYQLVLTGRDRAALEAVAAACATPVEVIAGDITDPAFIEAAVAHAVQCFGHIDVLVNNAGTANRSPVQSADLDAWREVLDVNFTATMVFSRALVPAMIERKSGAIVNISSISGRNTDPGSAIYAATKHALNGFSGCLYEDVREFGIKVSTIMPGFVETGLTADIGKLQSAMIKADDVAAAVEFVLTSSASCCPTEIVLRPQQRP